MNLKVKKGVKILIGLIIFFVIAFIFSLFASNWNIETEEVIFEAEKGESVVQIANNIKKKGILNYSTPLIGYLTISGKAGKVKAGNYRLDRSMTLFDIANILTNGETLIERVTIVEGWTINNIGNHLEDSNFCSAEEFYSVSGLPDLKTEYLTVNSQVISELKEDFFILSDIPTEASLEGYLFPDTYIINEKNPESLVRRMLANLENKISTDLLIEINKSGRDLHEVIIMASLLEKEVISYEDKRIVSDILWRRLKAGIPLQIDATINYITSEHLVEVKNSHLEIDSPYNTYQNLGLPKGPISNPGMESIEAAVRPQENDYWYYLSDPETKKTIFSRTHRDHVQSKNQYLR